MHKQVLISLCWSCTIDRDFSRTGKRNTSLFQNELPHQPNTGSHEYSVIALRPANNITFLAVATKVTAELQACQSYCLQFLPNINFAVNLLSFPARCNLMSFSFKIPRCLLKNPNLEHIICGYTAVMYSGVRRQEPRTDHLPLACASVRNSDNCISYDFWGWTKKILIHYFIFISLRTTW
jgi:hypothetical protein